MSGGTPAFAQSVSAFSSAMNSSAVVTTAKPLQFPDTGQLHGLCGQTLGASAFTGGLVNAGDPSTGLTGALIGGTQGFADGLCGLMGGPGAATTPQSVNTGAQDVHTAINGSPMASGTIAMAPAAPSGNTALDAINGTQQFANSMFSILSGCGCGGSHAPAVASPQNVINTANDTSAAVTANPMASGIIALGQTPTGSGNVALDAINGTTAFANSLFSIVNACGCGSGLQPTAATPQSVATAAGHTANAITGSNVGSAALAFGQALPGGPTGNVATDLVNGADVFFVALNGTANQAAATAQQSATAAANVASAVAQQQSAAIANDAIGGDFITIVPTGPDGAPLPMTYWN